jgi:hypothetical protein
MMFDRLFDRLPVFGSGSVMSVFWVLAFKCDAFRISTVFGFSFGFAATFSPGLTRGTFGFLIGAMFCCFQLCLFLEFLNNNLVMVVVLWLAMLSRVPCSLCDRCAVTGCVQQASHRNSAWAEN